MHNQSYAGEVWWFNILFMNETFAKMQEGQILLTTSLDCDPGLFLKHIHASVRTHARARGHTHATHTHTQMLRFDACFLGFAAVIVHGET